MQRTVWLNVWNVRNQQCGKRNTKRAALLGKTAEQHEEATRIELSQLK